MHFWEMERRFDKCKDIEKTILRVIKTLYDCGICYGNLFPLYYIKIAAKKDGLELKGHEWTYWFENLEAKEFITLENNGVQAEEVYLEDVVELPAKIKDLDVFKNSLTIFSGQSTALFKLGNRACDIGIFSLEIAEYMKIAIKAYEEALKVGTLDPFPIRFPLLYATTQKNLGYAYSELAEVEGRIKNCTKAIEAYEEALKVGTLDKFPFLYASTQNNLGYAYIRLAEVEDKSENCKKAVTACEEALKVSTLYDFSFLYVNAQSNIGDAYSVLAEVEDKSENCKKAIKIYEEALKVYTLDRFPMQYSTILNNLGITYRILAGVEDKSENCKKAIKIYEEALNVRTLDDFPSKYAITKMNLGAAYDTLAGVEDKSIYCMKAIEAYEEALKVRILDSILRLFIIFWEPLIFC